MLRSEHEIPININSRANEARLEFELACLLRKDVSVIHNISVDYIKDILPSLSDDRTRLNALNSLCTICFKTKAPYNVTVELCEAALRCLPSGGDRAPMDVMIASDLQMICIARAHEER